MLVSLNFIVEVSLRIFGISLLLGTAIATLALIIKGVKLYFEAD